MSAAESAARRDGGDKPTVAILAGGFGTRLADLTRDLPKPMIAVAGRPFLAWVIESFASRGFHRFALLVGYRAEAIESYFGDGARFGIDIRYSRETEPLGTGGAVRDARFLLGDRFILTFGDVLRRFDYDRFVQVHAEPCLAVCPRITVGNTIIESDRVIRFDKSNPTLPYIDAGFSLMPSHAIGMLPREGACSFEQVVYAGLAERGLLGCEVVDHDFYDIGEPDELARTRAALEGSA